MSHLVQVQEINPYMVQCVRVQLDEEIEIKLLRNEQVPRAHPKPSFPKKVLNLYSFSF